MWDKLQQYASGLSQRMSGQYPGMALQDMQYGMPNNNYSLIDAFKRAKGLLSPQIMSQKYVRDVAPPTMGANAPTAYGDARSAMATPYSPSRMLQPTQYRAY